MDSTVIVVNGKPRSGKDSFSNFIVRYCDEKSVPCDVWSTIDIEKEILEEYIKPYDPNSNNDRGFLSDFKSLLNEYYDYTFESFKVIVDDSIEGITIVHSREWKEIQRFKEYCEKNNVNFYSVYVIGKDERHDFTNYSDKFCDDKINLYNYKIQNFGTLEELEQNAKQFCESRLF